MFTHPEWTRRLLFENWLTQACDGMSPPDYKRHHFIGYWLTQTEHGGFWVLIGCWLTQTEYDIILSDVDLPRLNMAACDWMLTHLDWTRRFIIGRCWLTQTEHGGIWLDVVDLPRQNKAVYDWTLMLTYPRLNMAVYPDWTRRFMIERCWLTQTEHGGLWLDVVDLPRQNKAVYD